MTDLTGFDESLAAVIARRRDGAPCPHTGEVFAPLPTDAANAAALVARARAATPGARRDAVLRALGCPLVQLPLWSDERRAA